MITHRKLQIEHCKLQGRRAAITPLLSAHLRALSGLLLLGLLAAASSAPAFAAEAKPRAPERLLDRTPFDQIVLNQAGGGKTIEVLPLNLPQRPLPTVPTQGAIKVRLLDRPTEEFEVSWASVAQVRVFEQVLLDEAQRLTAAGKFDEAYDYYARLGAEFPTLAPLNDAVCDYLRLNALALYKSKQHDRALSLLLTLYQRNPSYAGLPGAVEAVAGEIIQRYLREGNYAAARRVLEVWENQFRGVSSEKAADWRKRFELAAARQVAEANQLLGQKQYIAARKAVGKATAIWPNLASGNQVMAQIGREFPFVTVGVLETSPRTPTRRIDDWASLRTSMLTQPLLAEETDFGSEGGAYRSPFGEWNLDETGRELTLKLTPAGAASAGRPTPDAIARYFLTLATPGKTGFRPDLAALLDGVSIGTDNSVVVHLKRVHVRPESLLQIPLPPSEGNQMGNGAAAGPFVVADYAADQVVFAAAKNGAPQRSGPQAIVEQTMASDDAALAALMAGEVDVLDRVPPWQVEQLRAIQDVRVASYKLPTVHVLIPNLQRPLLVKREFRRALCFGIDRKWIVDRVLLGGATIPGFAPISGPFPSGVSLNDPIRYGFNSQIAPRPYEPRLAAILATVAWAAVQNPPQKDKGKDKDADKKKELVITPLPELTLAHPNDPVARIACQSIQSQLQRAGIPVKLVEFTANDLLAGKVDCDLRYAELAVWEPIADAPLLLGPQGLTGDLQSPYLEAALRNLSTATNWKDVRARLSDLHEIAHHELPVIPLWQTVNFFAYRANVRGIGESPVTLYQNVEQWSSAPDGNVARVDVGAPK